MYILASGVIDFGKMIPWIPTFIEGTVLTVVLSLITVIFGSIIGLLVTALQQSRIKIFNWLAYIYVQVIRGTPLLIQLFIWLYALPLINITLPAIPLFGEVYGSRDFLTAVVALAINSGAYVSELLRAGLNSIDKGQMEAGRSLGLSRLQTMRHIIIPQAIRVILPGLGNEFITMIKESSIVSVVGIFDVMYSANIIKATTFSIFEPLMIVAVIYFILTFSLTSLMKVLERKLEVYD